MIKFISYTGVWPTLCSGVLTLNINGKEWKFGHELMSDEQNEEAFWSSGGTCGFYDNYSESYVRHNEWDIDETKLPKELQKIADEIADIFNDNVPYGCCGGCL